MKYYKYSDDFVVPEGVRYIETDDVGNSFREVTSNGEVFLASNILYPHYGMIMSDQPGDYDKIEEVTSISKAEFDSVWQKSLLQNFFRWEFAKLEFPLGSFIEGGLKLFYPQGVIVGLGNSVLGIADYRDCKASTKPAFLYPKHRVTATVSGYDEMNQWIILDAPTVHEEIISDK